MAGSGFSEGTAHNGRNPVQRPKGRRARQFRYQVIADALRRRIAAGDIAPGKLLESESELSELHDASRVTVRKALEALRDEGLIDSRQGFGWFVAAVPVQQRLVHFGTIEAQLAASGRATSRRIVGFGFVPTPRRARDVLQVATVLQVRRVNLADGAPFARVTVWVPEDLADDLSRARVERASIYDALPVELSGATQTIGAAAASADDAVLLEIPEGSPVLRCERITFATDGRAVLCSEFVFAAHRTEFVVDLPRDDEAWVAPTGLRLVE